MRTQSHKGASTPSAILTASEQTPLIIPDDPRDSPPRRNQNTDIFAWIDSRTETEGPIYPATEPPDAPPTQELTAFVEERNYADPIDGMPFESGEPVISCICGLGYRGESVLWLHEAHKGQCVQCGGVILIPKELL